MKSMDKKYIIFFSALALLMIGILTRLIPHAPEMTSLTAIAFISSLYLEKKWAFILPVLVLLLSDIFIGFYDWRILISVYGSFVLIGAVSLIARKYRGILPVGLSVLGSSILFFLTTNAAVWLFSPWYAKNISGLLYSYTLGLPFLRNMIIGDVVYSCALVVLFETVIIGYKFLQNKHNSQTLVCEGK